ncbi:MAG: outer membrane beta-barrel protein [Blastocatellia bacterium]
MQKLLLLAALTLALPIIAQAQESPRAEIFGGYSYIRLDDNDVDEVDRDLNGFNVSTNVTVFKKWFGLKADVSGHFGDSLVAFIPSTDVSHYLFLGGPQFSLRKNEKIQPFAHALAGMAYVKLSNELFPDAFTDTGFALAAGGGVDLKALSSRLSIRLLQADYVLTRFDGVSSHNIRASAGIVLRFGKVE